MAEQKIVVCRTHFVDDRLVAFARSVHGQHGYHVIFAVDETSGQVDTFEFEKISLTRDAFVPLKLFTEIGDVFWRCGDYCLYLARLRYPDCDVFWMIEYDVTINQEKPAEFFKEFDELHRQDFLASHFRKPEDWWGFRIPMEARSKDVYRSYFPLVRLSGRALDFALAERTRATTEIRLVPDGERPEWPNDEVFVATVLRNAGFKCNDFNDFGRFYTEQTFWMSVLVHPSSLPPYDGLIYHAVRTGRQYLKLVIHHFLINPLPEPLELLQLAGTDWSLEEVEDPLKEAILPKLEGIGDNPDRVMAPNGVIAQVLAHNSAPPVLRAVIKALVHNRMLECLQRFREWQTARWWPQLPILDNVALAKPAWQSSVSRWSVAPSVRIDAEGGNNGRLDGDFGFHTDDELCPWWTVDLMHLHLIQKVRIHNRQEHSERLSGFRLLASVDGYNWRVVHQNSSMAQVDIIELVLQARTRFLRLQLPEARYLHFREFEAYGVLCS